MDVAAQPVGSATVATTVQGASGSSAAGSRRHSASPAATTTEVAAPVLAAAQARGRPGSWPQGTGSDAAGPVLDRLKRCPLADPLVLASACVRLV